MHNVINSAKSYEEYLKQDEKDQLSVFMDQTPFFQRCLDTNNPLSPEMLKIIASYIYLLGKEAELYQNDLLKKLSEEQGAAYQLEKQIVKEEGKANCYDYNSLQLLGYTGAASYLNPIEEVHAKRISYQEGARGVFYDEKDRRRLEINTFTRYALSRVALLQSIHGDYYIYSKRGVYKQAGTALLKQLFRKILDEYDDTMWSTSYENTYMAALVGLVPFNDHIHTGKESLLNFKNGVYDLDSGVFQAHSPSFYSLVQLDYSYDAAAACPKFEKFLDDVFEQDPERVLLIQQMLGYLLLKDVKIHKAFIFLGSGSNGKSLLAELITYLLGKANISTTPLSKLNGTFALQNMNGKLVNISSENEMKTSFNTQDFKMLTSGDMVEVELKYKDAFSQRLTTKLLILLNKMMDSDDRSDGYYRRLQIIPFNKTYVELKEGETRKDGVNYMNPCLIDELTEELPGIMNFAITGLQMLKDNGFRLTSCRASDEALEQYKRQQNPIEAFIDECVMYSEGSKIKRSDITKEFEKWLQECGISSFRKLSKPSVLEQFLGEVSKKQWIVKESKIQGTMYLTNLQFHTENRQEDGYISPIM